jgi:hypothetical protein
MTKFIRKEVTIIKFIESERKIRDDNETNAGNSGPSGRFRGHSFCMCVPGTAGKFSIHGTFPLPDTVADNSKGWISSRDHVRSTLFGLGRGLFCPAGNKSGTGKVPEWAGFPSRPY